MKILCIAHSSYEVYLVACVIALTRPQMAVERADLVCPVDVAAQLPPKIRGVFEEVVGMNLPRITMRPHSDYRTNNSFRRWLEKRRGVYSHALLGAWRSTATNMVARVYGTECRIIALRQGGDEPTRFTGRRPVEEVYHWLFNAVFGQSQVRMRWHRDDSNMSYVNFVDDPTARVIRLAEERSGRPQYPNEVLIPPPLFSLKSLFCPATSGRRVLLLAGERTPLTQTWNAGNEAALSAMIDGIRDIFAGWQLIFKPRSGLTKLAALDLRGFEVIDSQASLERYLLEHRVDRVLSVKSTASKLAHYLGIPAAVFYPALRLESEIESTIDAFFGDVPSMRRITRTDDLAAFLNDRNSVVSEAIAVRYCAVLTGADVA